MYDCDDYSSSNHALQIRELILLTHPEIVAVELCKERLGLLVGSGDEDMARSTWHSRKVSATSKSYDRQILISLHQPQ